MNSTTNRLFASLAAASLLTAAPALARGHLQMKDLPAAVQKTVQEETTNATLVGIEKEAEKGRTVYEVETKRDGRTRDLLVDSSGVVVEVEEEVALTSLPDAARKAIERAAARGTIEKVESITRGATIEYEATIKTGGKSSETTVTSTGEVKHEDEDKDE